MSMMSISKSISTRVLLRLLLVVLSALYVVDKLMVYHFDGDGGYPDQTFISSQQQIQQQQLKQQQKQCKLFLAESSIPMAGLGVYTATPIAEGDPIQSETNTDICIYITDAEKGLTEFGTHTWQSYRFGAQWEGGKHHTRAACQGVITLFNSIGHSNDEYASARPAALPQYIHTNAGLQRHKNPGAGAITHYYGASSIARRDVSPGWELTNPGGSPSHEIQLNHSAPPVRPLEWLYENGMCADNIQAKTATDPEMGRGAFATRSLAQGTVVTVAPLQIFKDRAPFAKQSPEQLLVNYCFQPKGSNMLLFPYGPGFGLINHNSKNPNVVLQWSSHYMNHKHWLDLPMEQFWTMQYPGSLIVQVVALRDIQQGEEIMMDYGATWEQAWQRHVETWKSTAEDTDDYVYPMDMNHLTQPLRTLQEQQTNPYPKNLMTVLDTGNWHRSTNQRDHTTMKWKPSQHWPEYWVACQILTRQKIKDSSSSDYDYLYNVSLSINHDDYSTTTTYLDYDVPQSAISFVDKPYQSDQHLPNAFRQPMEFPQHMTPPQWLVS